MPSNWNEFVKGLPVKKASPREVAEKTYPKSEFKRTLRQKRKYYQENRHKVPAVIEKELPSYKVKDWNKKISVYDAPEGLTLNRDVVKGVAHFQQGAKEPEILIAGDRSKSSKLSTLAHEMTHVLQFKKDPPPVKKLSTWQKLTRPPDARAYPPVKQIKSTDESRGYEEMSKPDEVVAKTTEAVRAFYKKHGRHVKSREDVLEGIDTLQLQKDSNRTEKGIFDALRNLDYIGELGQMLVKKENKKKKFIS